MAFGANNAFIDAPISETMPFPKQNGKYVVSSTVTLYKKYTDRLVNLLDNARQNGQAVELILFPGSDILKQQNWPTSPWNPNLNNMSSPTGANCPGPTVGGDGLDVDVPFPEFYQICITNKDSTAVCADADLTCLGKIEKNYVDQMVGKIQSPGNQIAPFKNVIFEIMNEAPWKDASTPPKEFVKLSRYVKWHNTVASWIKRNHNYFVSANAQHGEYADLTACCPHSPECTDDAHCTCNLSLCGNANKTYLLANIDIPTFHCIGLKPQDTQSGCDVAEQASWRFKKPVIMDDDGNMCLNGRSNNNTLGSWATGIKDCSTPLGGKGRVHYNHLDENKYMPENNTVCNLTTEGSGTNRKLDCKALDKLGDAGPSDLCTMGLTCSCPPDTGIYCFTVPAPRSGNANCIGSN